MGVTIRRYGGQWGRVLAVLFATLVSRALVLDYLLRNFNLFRLESTYEIRQDVEDAVVRLDPRCGFPDRTPPPPSRDSGSQSPVRSFG